MSVIYKNGQYYGQEGGGSASFPPGGDAGQALIKNSGADDDVKWGNPEEGRAKSSAIAPVFDEEATYAEGDRVTYEDELYVFNKAHTGAWDSADADKSDVDSEIPDAMSASDLSDVKAAFTGMNQGAPLRMMNYSTEEQVVGTWIDGKPLYQKSMVIPRSEMLGSGETKYAHGIEGAENIWFASDASFLQLTSRDGLFFWPLNGSNGNSAYSFYGVWVRTVGDANQKTISLYIGNSLWSSVSGDSSSKIILTFQYTKTTD